MGRKRRGQGSWVALAAAYILVIQSILGAFALGATAAPLPLDAFGTIICLSHETAALPGDDGSSGPHKMPDCCTIGCSLFQAAFTPAIAHEGPLFGLNRESATVFRAPPPLVPRASEGSPGNPRAPPFLS